ncbi:hypothetical protein AX774_g5093 [Zancudomyces culisetae]|uniref:BHLH domain-containing protein n=1 Tax=Zancudomyces culisetae TaxID=1213189 RepID=A0A1R1PKG0_ZANCU|nr:hypothetical protein AX774_g5093 [Zancudomyces culisetae]|eukprot:OMH81444.1 hypothetical protein AX774_g5093 [Zancudomyces culisetae]
MELQPSNNSDINVSAMNLGFSEAVCQGNQNIKMNGGDDAPLDIFNSNREQLYNINELNEMGINFTNEISEKSYARINEDEPRMLKHKNKSSGRISQRNHPSSQDTIDFIFKCRSSPEFKFEENPLDTMLLEHESQIKNFAKPHSQTSSTECGSNNLNMGINMEEIKQLNRMVGGEMKEKEVNNFINSFNIDQLFIGGQMQPSNGLDMMPNSIDVGFTEQGVKRVMSNPDQLGEDLKGTGNKLGGTGGERTGNGIAASTLTTNQLGTNKKRSADMVSEKAFSTERKKRTRPFSVDLNFNRATSVKSESMINKLGLVAEGKGMSSNKKIKEPNFLNTGGSCHRVDRQLAATIGRPILFVRPKTEENKIYRKKKKSKSTADAECQDGRSSVDDVQNSHESSEFNTQLENISGTVNSSVQWQRVSEQRRRDAMRENFDILKRMLPEQYLRSDDGRELARPVLLARFLRWVDDTLIELETSKSRYNQLKEANYRLKNKLDEVISQREDLSPVNIEEIKLSSNADAVQQLLLKQGSLNGLMLQSPNVINTGGFTNAACTYGMNFPSEQVPPAHLYKNPKSTLNLDHISKYSL